MLSKLPESDVHLIVQALDLLLASKQDALKKVTECGPALTPQDFGIPQIFGLMDKIDYLMVPDELKCEVSA